MVDFVKFDNLKMNWESKGWCEDAHGFAYASMRYEATVAGKKVLVSVFFVEELAFVWGVNLESDTKIKLVSRRALEKYVDEVGIGLCFPEDSEECGQLISLSGDDSEPEVFELLSRCGLDGYKEDIVARIKDITTYRASQDRELES